MKFKKGDMVFDKSSILLEYYKSIQEFMVIMEIM